MAFPIAAALGLGSAVAGLFGKKPKPPQQMVGFEPYRSNRQTGSDGELERLLRIRAMLQAMSGNGGATGL